MGSKDTNPVSKPIAERVSEAVPINATSKCMLPFLPLLTRTYSIANVSSCSRTKLSLQKKRNC
ncbi:hypothetical protein SCLCIDRAFT_1212776, partial [Scleroderma citrinum Foug A]